MIPSDVKRFYFYSIETISTESNDKVMVIFAVPDEAKEHLHMPILSIFQVKEADIVKYHPE